MNVSLNAFALFGLLEGLIVLLVVGAGGIFKWRSAQRTADTLRAELRQLKSELKRTVAEHKNKPAEVVRNYGDFLNEQLAKSSVLLGENPQLDAEPTPEDPAELARRMLAARHQFLQLELDVHAAPAGHDVEAQRQAVVKGMQTLLAGLAVGSSDESTHAESVTDEDSADESVTAAASRLRSEEIKLREQVEHLRTVVGNQHDVMRELRQLLESSDDESEELQAALRKLNDAESQGIELQRCLDVMEQENERIKNSSKSNGGTGKDLASPDGDMLRDLVGNQQRTIGKLQSMLRTLTPDSGKSKEFEEAINKIQRTNNDLSSCVMVLEDENSHLRDKVDTLQVRIANLEGNVETDGDSVQQATDAPVIDPEITPDLVAEGADDQLVSEVPAAVAVDLVTDTVSNGVDDQQRDTQASSAATESVTKPPATNSVDNDVDVDALLDAAAAQKEVATAASPHRSTAAHAESTIDSSLETEPAQGVSDSDDFDVDALLDEAANRTATPAAAEAKAVNEQTVAEKNNSPANANPDLDATEVEQETFAAPQVAVPIDTEQTNSAPAPAPTTAKPPSVMQGEAEQEDIDALLADLFANADQAEGGSKP